jgi:hypothetical protein
VWDDLDAQQQIEWAKKVYKGFEEAINLLSW